MPNPCRATSGWGLVIFAPVTEPFFAVPPASRRTFLRYAGATSASAALLLAGCKKDDDPQPSDSSTIDPNAAATSLGTGEVAYLNLLQAGKQVSVALYERMLASTTGPADFSTSDRALLGDILDHEILHRNTLPLLANSLRALTVTADLSLPTLTLTFEGVDLSTRAKALTAALQLENLQVSAAAGLARYFTRSGLHTVVGKILSVDARHGATLADLLQPDSVFDPATGSTALNQLRKPSAVIALLNQYLSGTSRLLVGALA